MDCLNPRTLLIENYSNMCNSHHLIPIFTDVITNHMNVRQELKLKVLQGKEGKNNHRVLRCIITGPKTAYDVYKLAEEELEYSTSNRRLRDLTKMGYLSRISSDIIPQGRAGKTLYGFTLRGAIAALFFTDDLTDKEWQMLIENHTKNNSLLALFHKAMECGLSIKEIKDLLVVPLLNGVKSGFLNLDAEENILAVNSVFTLLKGMERTVGDLQSKKRIKFIEAIFHYGQTLSFEKYFGSMMIVMLGMITLRYISNDKMVSRLFENKGGEISLGCPAFEFSDKELEKIFPFLNSYYSDVAWKSIQAFRELSSFLYGAYDCYGEG